MKCIVYFITEKDISTLIPHTEVSQLLFQYFNMLYLDKITLYKQKKNEPASLNLRQETQQNR